jgi:flagellar biosynthesis protein FliQ
MNPADAIDIVQKAMWAVIVICTPAVIPAMVIGIVIALFQALTQVQEATLTFVPKIMAVFFSVILAANFIGAQMGTLTNILFGRIESGF